MIETTAAQREMLRILWEAGPKAEVVWTGRRYGIKRDKCPHPSALKQLCRMGLVEVETRTHAAWHGEDQPPFGTQEAVRAWRLHQEQIRNYRTEVTLAARLLPKGIGHCSEVLGY